VPAGSSFQTRGGFEVSCAAGSDNVAITKIGQPVFSVELMKFKPAV